MDAGAVRQSGIAERALGIDVATGRLDDGANDLEQLVIVPEADVGQMEFAPDLHVDVASSDHHHLRDVGVRQQRLDRPEVDGGAVPGSTGDVLAHCVSLTEGGQVRRVGSPTIETLPFPLMVAVQLTSPPAIVERYPLLPVIVTSAAGR